ncbi:MAG TPA: M42 family metallopeptidase [Thermomicrobiales bacterium]|nr:M42 family metallopeptidase [Thermomicrobiales bacterium]
MQEHSRAFLERLLATASPSGFETEAARVWRAEAESFADEVEVDSNGNSLARLRGDGPRVMIEGHIDEIGVMITHIDDDGFLWFSGIGGWDDQVLVGQRVRVLGTHETVVGVIGKKPIHQLEPDERGKVSRMKTLWIDIGASSAEEARKKVEIGDPGVIEQPYLALGEDRIACRGIDNRIGAFIALEALRKLAEGERPAADVWAVAAVQEEVGLYGARTSAYNLDPDVAIVIDVNHATDHPDADVRGLGKIKIGGGPVFARGNAVHPAVFERLVAAARAEDIPYAVEGLPIRSGTDADAIARERGGIPTGIVSIPNRYMHSPSELVSLTDADNCAAVIAAFTRRLGTEPDFRRA